MVMIFNIIKQLVPICISWTSPIGLTTQDNMVKKADKTEAKEVIHVHDICLGAGCSIFSSKFMLHCRPSTYFHVQRP